MMMMMIFHACLHRTKDLCGTMHWDFLDNLPVRVTSISYSSYFKNFYFSCKRKIWISGLEILLSTERQTGEWSLTIWDALSNRKLGLGAWLRPREPDYLLPMQCGRVRLPPIQPNWDELRFALDPVRTYGLCSFESLSISGVFFGIKVTETTTREKEKQYGWQNIGCHHITFWQPLLHFPHWWWIQTGGVE